MTTEKKIGFNGVDNGVSQMFDKLRQQSRSLGQDMIADAQRFSKSGQEQLKYIEEQIRAIERRNKADREGLEFRAKQQFGDDKKGLSSALQQIQKGTEEDRMQVSLLRELIDTIKSTAQAELVEDKREVQARVLGEKGLFGRRAERPQTTEDALKFSLQRERLEGEQPQQKSFGQQLMGAFYMQQAIQMLQMLPGARQEEQVIGGMLGALPFGLGVIGNAYSRSSQEQLRAQQTTLRLSGLTGSRNQQMFGMSQFGMDYGESAQFAEAMFRSAGNKNLNIVDVAAAQRAYSLDQSMLSERAQVGRFSSGSDKFLEEITKILTASGLKEDRVIFAEVLKNQTSLVREFSRTSQKVNQDLATNAILSFSSLGGAFSMSDPRSMERIMQINSSLANPQNDIAKAENIAILRQMNPGAGLFDIMEQQEQGIQNMGFLRGVLRNAKSRFGGLGSQGAMLYLQKRLGLDFSSTRQLANNAQGILSGEIGEGEIQSLIGRDDVRKEGMMRTAELDVSAAQISNAFVEGATEGMLKVAELVGSKIADYIIEGMQAADKITSSSPAPTVTGAASATLFALVKTNPAFAAIYSLMEKTGLVGDE